MWWKRIATVSLVAGMFVSVFASSSGATEDDPIFEDGDYVLVIPGVGDFEFEVDYVDPVGVETVIAVVAPEGYSVDDDDPDKAAWKDAAGLEVEMKLDKIEGKVTWGSDGEATFNLPGGSIIVTEPVAGDFSVTASGIWTAFGSGGDWMVANNADIALADRFFKVEATADGIEVKAVSEPDDGFRNDLEYDEEAEEEEVEEEEVEGGDAEGVGHGEDRNKGKGKNN